MTIKNLIAATFSLAIAASAFASGGRPPHDGHHGGPHYPPHHGGPHHPPHRR